VTADTPVTPDLTAEVAKVLAVALCREAHNDYGLVAIPDDPDPRLRIAACFQCQRRAAHVAAEVTNAVVTALGRPEVVEAVRAHICKAGGDPDLGDAFHRHAVETHLAKAALTAIPEALGVGVDHG
jgi:hypothetical protein